MAAVVLLALSVRVVRQHEMGVQFRLGRLHGVREPGLRLIIPVVDVLRKVSLRTVTMPIQSQGIITRDNVSIDVAGVAYFHVVDAAKSVLAIESVDAAIREILDRTTVEWGVVVALVELKDITLPETMKPAMAHPLALQPRNLQSLVEIGVDKNTTVVFPAPLMSTIGDLSAFLQRETRAGKEQTDAVSSYLEGAALDK